MGFLGVFLFSLTLPATKLAIREIDPMIVGLGRGIIAAFFAGGILLVARQSLPSKGQIKSLLIVAMGVVIGFPLFTSLAMQDLPASHGGIMAGIVPMATVIAGSVVAKERPSLQFWIVGSIGSLAVIVFALLRGGGSLHMADLYLVLAILMVAVGYAMGGRLAQEMGGWRVICWALVLSAPFLIIPVAIIVNTKGVHASFNSWLAFGYVSVFSQLIAFFFWYWGLAKGGIARVSQIQLLQTFLTFLASWLLLDETIDMMMIGFALFVVLSVVISRRMPVR